MQGNEVFKMAVNTLGRIVDETLAANDMQKSDVDWLIPHQANIRIIQATARKLRMSMDHVVVTVDEHGNTSAASVPLALDTAVRDGRIKRGETLLMEAFGGVGVYATSPDELARAVNEAMDSGKPTLVNAVIDEKAGTESGRIGNLNPKSVVAKK